MFKHNHCFSLYFENRLAYPNFSLNFPAKLSLNFYSTDPRYKCVILREAPKFFFFLKVNYFGCLLISTEIGSVWLRGAAAAAAELFFGIQKRKV